MSDLVIEKLTAEQVEWLFVPLCDLLRDGVESGASIGYLLPLAQADRVSKFCWWRVRMGKLPAQCSLNWRPAPTAGIAPRCKN